MPEAMPRFDVNLGLAAKVFAGLTVLLVVFGLIGRPLGIDHDAFFALYLALGSALAALAAGASHHYLTERRFNYANPVAWTLALAIFGGLSFLMLKLVLSW